MSIANATQEENLLTISYTPVIVTTNFCGPAIPAYYFKCMRGRESDAVPCNDSHDCIPKLILYPSSRKGMSRGEMVRPKKHHIKPHPNKCHYKKSIKCKDDSGKLGLTLSECLLCYVIIKQTPKQMQYSIFLYHLVLAGEMRKVTFDVKHFLFYGTQMAPDSVQVLTKIQIFPSY